MSFVTLWSGFCQYSSSSREGTKMIARKETPEPESPWKWVHARGFS